MSILTAHLKQPDELARAHHVQFVSVEAIRGWSDLVAVRNAEYENCLGPKTSAAEAGKQKWLFRTGLIAGVLRDLDEKWTATMRSYVAAAVVAGGAKYTA